MTDEVANTVGFYKDGFFGYGEVGDFQYGSIWHILPILLLLAAIILTYIFRDKIKAYKHEKYIRYILAFVMMIVEMSYYWRILYAGNGTSDSHTLLTKLPVQVCTWSAILMVFLLTTENKHLFDYCIYVCLTLGVVPLFTPAVIVTTGPTYYRYYQFWLEHLIPIYSCFYLMFVRDKKIELKSIWKPFVLLLPGALLAIYLNSKIPEANYFYLAQHTEGDSIANILPTNVVARSFIYFGITSALFLAEYGIFYLVHYLMEKYKDKKRSENDAVNS